MHALNGKRVAFCGRLSSEKRSMVIAQLELIGGRHVERVTSKTDILVMPLGFDASNKPRQLLDAEVFQENGTLKIMGENEFLQALRSCQAGSG